MNLSSLQKAIFASLLVLVAAPSFDVQAMQGRLVGITGTNIFEISMSDASLTQIGTLTGSPGTIGELTYDWGNQILYMSSTSNQNLMTLDLMTSQWTTIGTYGLATTPVMHGLEFQNGSNRLFGFSGGSSHGYHLYDVNTSNGSATMIGTSPLTSFHNLGYNSNTGVMYMTNSNTDSFYTLDLTTGQPTLIGALLNSTNPNSLAFNQHSGVMYMIDNSTDNLYTMDLQTGVASIVGSVGSSNFLALAYVPEAIPEPSSVMVLGLLTLTALGRRRRNSWKVRG